MSEHELLYDEPDESIDQPPSEEEPDIAKLTPAYFAHKPGRDREAHWESLTDDERHVLQTSGIRGPATLLDEELNFQPVVLDTDEIRLMDADMRSEARAEFDKVTKDAEGVLNSGLRAAMRGELDASQDVLDRLATIRDEALWMVDPNERSLLLQRGAAIVEAVRGPKPGFDPAQVQKQRQFMDPVTRRMMLTETDVSGNQRTTVMTEEANPEQYARRPEKLPEYVSVDEFLSWAPRKRVRFVRERPQGYARLMRAADYGPEMSAAEERVRKTLKDVIR